MILLLNENSTKHEGLFKNTTTVNYANQIVVKKYFNFVVMKSFYSKSELLKIGFKSVGNDVLISRNSCFYGPENIVIGNNVRIDDFSVLSGNIIIGSNVHIATFCGLYGGKGIVLHDFSGLSSRVSIYSESDDYMGEGLTNPVIPIKFRVVSSEVVTIGKHALVGTGSTILPGGELSEGSVLGAMSLLKTVTDSWSIYVGIPAKKVKLRKSSIINNLETSFIHETNNKEC